MIDLKKPRLTEKDFNPCSYCKYHIACPDDGCKRDMEKRNRLEEFENAIESGELVPVVRGKWEVDECDGLDDVPGYSWIDFHCSKCNMDYGLEEGQYSWCPGEKIPYHFCPNCGAKMEVEHDNA